MATVRSGDVVADRFEVEALAGAGGMGRVHRARDRESGQTVALKVLARDAGSHVARFAHEARALAELSHPRVVRYVAHGSIETGEPYLAMEWLDGEDLACRLERGGLSVEQCVTVASCIADALAAAHARGIVHRDLKPSNVFLVEGRVDQVKVLDFGVARLASGTELTRTGTLVGTPAYMAPEQAQNGRTVDARADVFSLGCVLFECLTGTRAFAGDQVMAVLAKVLFSEPPRLRELRPEVPAALERLVAQMLAKDPDERPRDGVAVVEALAVLDEVVGSHPGGAATLTRSERRMMSFVLVERADSTRPTEDTLDDVEASIADVLRRGAETFGGRLEQLRDGTLVVSIAGSGPPTDLAAQAARCALWLQRNAVGHVALATGHGEATGGVAAAIDRAAALLREHASESAPGAIPIDETTARLLDGRFDVREGGSGPTLHGERELAADARLLLNRPTICVGRDSELSMLVSTSEACVADSHAQAVLVTGPAGIGKSRLLHELLVRLRRRAEPPAVWIARGDALRAGSALGLLAQAIRSACEVHGDEPLLERRSKLSAGVTRHVDAGKQRRITELLGEIIGAPFPEEESELLRTVRRNPQIMTEELRTAWLEYVRAECEAQPVLVVLEDLHWGDSPSVQFLDVALRELGGHRFMVLALARPEVHELFPKLWADRRMLTIALGPLSRTASERLVRQALGDEIGEGTVDRLVARADGNAFYLEELIRAAAERWDGELPETVVAMVQARLSALDDEDRRVLRAAAVFGEVFWPGGVAVLVGSSEREVAVERRLLGLVGRELLVRRPESRFSDHMELAFRHVLLREGAYELLTSEDRVLGHRLAGEWLERAGEHDSKLLALHFDRGGEGARAAVHYLRAAEQALEAGDHRVVLDLAGKGRSVTQEPEFTAEFRALECEAAWGLGDLHRALRTADEAFRHARPGSRAEGRALHSGAFAAIYLRDDDVVDAWMDKLRHAEPEPDAMALVAAAYFSCLTFLVWRARRDAIELHLSRLEQVAEPFMDHNPVCAAWVELSRVMHAVHVERDMWGFLEHALKAADHHQRSGASSTLPFIHLIMGGAYAFLGLYERAEEEHMRALVSAPPQGTESLVERLDLAEMRLDQRRFDDALSLAESVVRDTSATDQQLLHWDGRACIVEAHLGRGDAAAAEAATPGLYEVAASQPYAAMWYLAVLACVHLAQGRVKEAVDLAGRAYAQSRACGMGFCFRHAKLLLVRAEAFHALGDLASAREAIREAEADLLRRAEKIPDLAVRRCFLHELADHRRTLELARLWLGDEGR